MTRTVTEALDHLLIGASSLTDGIAWLETKTGVRAAIGGSHPGLGTCNALASLGPRQYIEIIAPDPEQDGIPTFYVPGLRGFKDPRAASWAAQAEDLGADFAAPLPTGFTAEGPRTGSRIRPDGTRLSWTLAFPTHREHGSFGGAFPFFIEWASPEAHPGRTTPSGLTLRSLTLGHPDPRSLKEALFGFHIEGDIRASNEPCLRVELESPRGLVTL